MLKIVLSVIFLGVLLGLKAQDIQVNGPDGLLKVRISIISGVPNYSVSYKDKIMLEDSPLGFISNIGDFSQGMTFLAQKNSVIDEWYDQTRIKKSKIHYQANELICTFSNSDQKQIDIIFRVSNNDLAFRYTLPQYGETSRCIIEKETTGFDFPQNTTTFICPQAKPMTGWMRSKPSYEEEYHADEPMGTPSQYGYGYTFPCLFHEGDNGWVLVSETGVSSLYCGSHLSEGTPNGKYSIAYPDAAENNGIGITGAGLALPGSTPWRTLTFGDNLKPIVETTIPFDVVQPLYAPSQNYKFGRSTWSWIMWQDGSVCYEDQVKYIDLAAAMGYEYCLIDGLWDKQIGYEKIPALVKYAQSKGVDIFMWYNSNGYWNDAPQGPKQRMNTSVARKNEMRWLKELGVKGLKVDFFGGDKQETMKLYEDILSDANEFGLMIIFHGCTLPRGWERMYPNYVGSEAVLASENLIFNQHFDDMEAFNACLHPFIRNTVGSMEFGPVLLNKRLNRSNSGGNIRKTSDIFEIATAVLYQNAVQNFALAPNNLTDAPALVIDFMKQVPTTWDETVFLDGYPGKYVVMARRHGSQWFVAGINAGKETLKLKLTLPMLAGQKVTRYFDDKNSAAAREEVTLSKTGLTEFTISTNGATIFRN